MINKIYNKIKNYKINYYWKILNKMIWFIIKINKNYYKNNNKRSNWLNNNKDYCKMNKINKMILINKNKVKKIRKICNNLF